MKYLLILALVAFAVAQRRKDDDDKRSRRRRCGPRIFVKRRHSASQDESYEFKFGIAGLKPLNESEVYLNKIVKGENGPELVETDFVITLTSRNKTEAEAMMENSKEENGDGDRGDDRQPKPHPKPKFNHYITGEVQTGNLGCDDQGPYIIHYGDKKQNDENDGKDNDKDNDKKDDRMDPDDRKDDSNDDRSNDKKDDKKDDMDDDEGKKDDKQPETRNHDKDDDKKHRTPKGAFFIKIKGCKRTRAFQ